MFKSLIFSALMAFGVSASAQGFQSTSLGDIDPWGVGTISQQEGALSNTLWLGTDPESLNANFAATNIRLLSDSMRKLTARALLSSARRPHVDTDNKILMKRVKLVQDLGSPEHYAALLRQTQTVQDTPNALEFEVDRLFAQGNLASACSRVRAVTMLSSYAMRARAACFALEDNITSAELALELARENGHEDAWLISVFGTMDTLNNSEQPAARLNSGLDVALSIAARLQLPQHGFSGLKPILAYDVAHRTDLDRSLRIQAANVAMYFGSLDFKSWLEAYEIAKPVKPDPVDSPELVLPSDLHAAYEANETEKSETNYVNTLDRAIHAAYDPSEPESVKARAYFLALDVVKNHPSRFHHVARILIEHVAALQSTRMDMKTRSTFALAAYAAQRKELVELFLDEKKNQSFITAWIEGLDILAGRSTSHLSSSDISRQLTVSANENQRLSAQRMIHMFSVWNLPISTEAQKFLSEATEETLNSGEPIPKKTLLQMEVALRSGSLGESILITSAGIGRHPERINMFDLSTIIRALADKGLTETARELSLEGISAYNPKM